MIADINMSIALICLGFGRPPILVALTSEPDTEHAGCKHPLTELWLLKKASHGVSSSPQVRKTCPT